MVTFSHDSAQARRDRAAKIITALFAGFGKMQDAERIAVYSSVLADIPPDVLNKACKRLLLEKTFVPAPAEILAACRSLIAEVNPDARVKTWAEAWTEIRRGMEHGYYLDPPPEWSTEAIKTAVNAFGWRDLCSVLERDMGTARAQLRRYYEDAVNRAKEKELNDYILNAANLLPAATVKKIGTTK